MIPTQNTISYDAQPWATWSLIASCVGVFLYQLSLSAAEGERFVLDYGLVPARYTHGDWAAAYGLSRANVLPFFSNMFLHGGVVHIASNLWTLWVFAPALEDRLGPWRFLVLYFSAGLAASLLHFVFNFTSDVPALGASGAIAGVIAAYARRFPYAWVNVLQPIGFLPLFFMMPALLFAGLWFLTQIVQATGSMLLPAAGGIAWWAHVGGFAAGWILSKRLSPPSDAFTEGVSAYQSFLWPWRQVLRWMTWWTRR